MKNYDHISILKDIYLEDSYVLDVIENENELIFKVEFVLLENHRKYTKVKPGEQYCYLQGNLVFNKCKYKWNEKIMKSNPGIDPEEDFGNIDTYQFDGQKHHLTGGWGDILVETKELPSIVFQNLE